MLFNLREVILISYVVLISFYDLFSRNDWSFLVSYIYAFFSVYRKDLYFYISKLQKSMILRTSTIWSISFLVYTQKAYEAISPCANVIFILTDSFLLKIEAFEISWFCSYWKYKQTKRSFIQPSFYSYRCNQ